MRCLLLFVLLLIAQVSATCEFRLVLAIRQQNVDQLEELLFSVSDPKSPEYGAYRTVQQLSDLVGPSEDDVRTLKNWLSSFGIENYSLMSSRDFLEAFLDEKQATELRPYMKDLPDDVAKLVDFKFLEPFRCQPKAQQKSQPLRVNSQRVPKVPEAFGTPNAQKAAYGIPKSQKAINKTNSQMVWGPGTFGFLATDLKTFYRDFDIDNDPSLLVSQGYPGVPGGDNFGEGTLDTTYISSMGMGAKTIVYNSNNSDSTEEGPGFGPALLNFVTALANQKDVPYVLSMSLGSLSWASCDLMCSKYVSEYSGNYSECLQFVQYTQRQVCMFNSQTEVARINVEFMKLGTRGVTLLGATGDGGSHFSFEPFAPTSRLARDLNAISCEYNFPTFPASSPYVVGVGGTQWVSDPKKPVAWSGSGSGFSWQFPMPQYQAAAVTAYLKNNANQLPPAKSFNASNRAYPDVSALSIDVPLVLQGSVTIAGGTSASTPTVAGILTLINDLRLNKGLPVLGFVNARLYQIANDHPGEAFYDVTSGNSKTSCDTGFPAAVGWDPVTGLGSPLWDGLVKYLTVD